MEQNDKRLTIGIAIFTVLFGAGLLIVFDHPLWGWVFMVAGAGGLVLGVIKRVAGLRLSNAIWIIAIVATWALLSYDIYDRHHDDMSKWTDLATLKEVTSRTFKNETVVIDGKHFYGPTFDNVTFIYNGTAGFVFDDVHFVPPPPGQVGLRLESKNQVVKATMNLTATLAQAAGCSAPAVKNIGPIEVDGITPQK